MPPLAIDKNSAGNISYLLTFEYENPITYVRYIRYDKSLTLDGNVYSPKPEIEVKLAKFKGSPAYEESTIEIETDSFLEKLKGTFPPVTVTVSEYSPSSVESPVVVAKGIITRSEFNTKGAKALVTLTIGTAKKNLQGTVSIPISRKCPWIFGSSPCQYSLETNKATRTIIGISNNVITISAPLTLDISYWKFGSIKYRGFGLSIHNQLSGVDFVLNRPCVAHWLNQAVDFYPGCDGTNETCEKRGQISNFGGIGLFLPTRDVRIYGN